MIDTRLDSYTEHLLFVENPDSPKPETTKACLACGTNEVISLASFNSEDLDDRPVGPTGLALVTKAIGIAWFQKPGTLGTHKFDLRSKSPQMDVIILGITTSIMVGTITFILGWQIGLIAACFWASKAYIQHARIEHTESMISDKEQQRRWDAFVEKEVLERRQLAWNNMGYCRECGTVHDLKRKKFTPWYNMLELFDDFAPSKK